MDTSNIIALSSLAVGVILGVGAIMGTRRWGTRRGRLLFDHESTPLVPEIPGSSDLLQVTFRDIPVPEPNLLSLRLVNVGPRDISSAHFDGGIPIRIDLGCTLYGVVHSSHPRRIGSGAVGSAGVLYMKPGLLHRREEIAIDVVVSGQPNPSLANSLVDVDVISGDSFDWRRDLARTAIESLTLSLPFGRNMWSLADAIVQGSSKGRGQR